MAERTRRDSSFRRLQEELGKVIANMPAGERLPSEPKLAERLGVSRATLREAMRAFEGQGIIRRRQGVGTFVISHTHIIESGLEVLESIETLAKRIDLDVEMGLSNIQYVDADTEQAQLFKVSVGSPLLHVDRVIHAEGRPAAYLIDILSDDVVLPHELKKGFTGSVLDFIIKRGTPKLANSVADIQAVAATSEVARLLEIQRGDVLLCLTAKLFTEEGCMIDYSTSYFLPGYFHFHVVRHVGGL
ncbi:MAG: GntR family transcriptional regulator [Anaerolineae bacterium]|jgi:GntR family transcriptional regulator|nr:GntR family transcriptional regulator [Anaerolineae bacterium]